MRIIEPRLLHIQGSDGGAHQTAVSDIFCVQVPQVSLICELQVCITVSWGLLLLGRKTKRLCVAIKRVLKIKVVNNRNYVLQCSGCHKFFFLKRSVKNCR